MSWHVLSIPYAVVHEYGKAIYCLNFIIECYLLIVMSMMPLQSLNEFLNTAGFMGIFFKEYAKHTYHLFLVQSISGFSLICRLLAVFVKYSKLIAR